MKTKFKLKVLSLTLILIISLLNVVYATSNDMPTLETESIIIFNLEEQIQNEIKPLTIEIISGSDLPMELSEIEVESNEATLNESTQNISPLSFTEAAVLNYNYFSKNSSLNRMTANAATVISPFGVTIPQWTIHVNGNFYKNHRLHSTMPSTQKYAQLRVDTSASDWSAFPGDYYEADSFHRVYDYYNVKIWDKSEYSSTSF